MGTVLWVYDLAKLSLKQIALKNDINVIGRLLENLNQKRG